MASASIKQNGPPPPAEVRAQVQRMTASDVFATSPQLVRISSVRRRGRAARARRTAQGLHHRRRGAAARHELRSADRSDRARRGDAAAPRDRALLRGCRERTIPSSSSCRAAATCRASPGARSLPRSACAEPPEIVLQPGNGMPTLRVAPFVIVGTRGYARDRGRDASASKIAEAFALFEVDQRHGGGAAERASRAGAAARLRAGQPLRLSARRHDRVSRQRARRRPLQAGRRIRRDRDLVARLRAACPTTEAAATPSATSFSSSRPRSCSRSA